MLADALDWLFAQQERGVHPGLARMRALLAELEHPERAYRAVQVGGTNGKGSVTRMLAQILRAAGRGPVGEYTSPHLHRFAERMRVDGREIGEDDLASGIARLRGLHGRVPATFFELATGLALEHFRRSAVACAVLEVGLGGRLDATTAAPAELAVITNVALDHTAVLGGTLEAIADEKAGILREGRPAITGATGPALGVLRARASEVGADLWALGEEIRLETEHLGFGGSRLRVSSPFGTVEARTRLLGRHQAANAALAVAAAQRLGVRASAVREGLDRARWPGRLELVPGEPPVMVDAAHNPAGARALAEAVRSLHPGPVTLVVAGMADKDLAGVAAELRRVADRVVVTRPALVPRAAEPARLAAHYPRALIRHAVPDALDAARERTPPGGIVLVAGTIPLVAQALEHLRGEGGEGRERLQ